MQLFSLLVIKNISLRQQKGHLNYMAGFKYTGTANTNPIIGKGSERKVFEYVGMENSKHFVSSNYAPVRNT